MRYSQETAVPHMYCRYQCAESCVHMRTRANAQRRSHTFFRWIQRSFNIFGSLKSFCFYFVALDILISTHTWITLCLERFYPLKRPFLQNPLLLVVSLLKAPPSPWLEMMLIAASEVCLCVRVCLRSRFRRGDMSWCTCVLAEMLLPPPPHPHTTAYTHTDANTRR